MLCKCRLGDATPSGLGVQQFVVQLVFLLWSASSVPRLIIAVCVLSMVCGRIRNIKSATVWTESTRMSRWRPLVPFQLTLSCVLQVSMSQKRKPYALLMNNVRASSLRPGLKKVCEVSLVREAPPQTARTRPSPSLQGGSAVAGSQSRGPGRRCRNSATQAPAASCAVVLNNSFRAYSVAVVFKGQPLDKGTPNVS